MFVCVFGCANSSIYMGIQEYPKSLLLLLPSFLPFTIEFNSFATRLYIQYTFSLKLLFGAIGNLCAANSNVLTLLGLSEALDHVN